MAAPRPLALALAAAAAALAAAPPALGGNRFVTEPADADQARATRYAALDSEGCLRQLTERGVPFQATPATKGVDTPVRLTGPVRGVRFEVIDPHGPAEQDPRTIADCRLALALDDLARVLRNHRVVSAQYYSMYRTKGVGYVKPGKRHQGARAMDLVSLKLADGTTFSVRNDFHGGIGAQTCGEKATKPRKNTAGARLWRSVVCHLNRMRSFNLVLTPNHDWAHRDHLHIEVRSGIRWFLIH